MSFLVDFIGVSSGLLSILQFGATLFQMPEGDGSTYKIAVGLDGTSGLENGGGNLPDVRVWNNNGVFVGMNSDTGNVENGTLADIHVNHDSQGVYTLFSANDDAICIAWATASWSDAYGGNQYAFLGDMGYECGANWYYSGMYYNSYDNQPNRNASNQAKCFWIDKNGDQPNTGFQIRWPSFGAGAFDENRRDPKEMCDGVSFGLRTEPDPSVINFWTRRKRNHMTAVERNANSGTIRRRSAGIASQLVIGDVEDNSARFVCESETSLGPDIANTQEQLFCDMDEKKLYGFCSESQVSGCFDLSTQQFYPPTNATLKGKLASPGSVSGKTYVRTHDWRKNGSSD